MTDVLTNFGATSATSSGVAAPNVIDLLAACQLKAGPQYARIAIQPSVDLATCTVEIQEGDVATTLTTTQTVVVKGLKANTKKAIPFVLENTGRYMGLKITTSSAATVYAALEFGA